MYIDKLGDIVKKCNKRANKVKPVDVNSKTYMNFNKENNFIIFNNFKVGEYHVRISKCKNIFAKDYVPNLSKEVFVIKKVKTTVAWTNLIKDLNGEEII